TVVLMGELQSGTAATVAIPTGRSMAGVASGSGTWGLGALGTGRNELLRAILPRIYGKAYIGARPAWVSPLRPPGDPGVVKACITEDRPLPGAVDGEVSWFELFPRSTCSGVGTT